MKTQQYVVILILIIIIGLAGYYLFPSQSGEPQPYVPADEMVQDDSSEEDVEVADGGIPSSLIPKTEWGVSFLKADDWLVAENTDTQVTLRQGGDGDTISISYNIGDRITTSDSKFGDTTFMFRNDGESYKWMRSGQFNEVLNMQESEWVPAEEVFYVGDMPVFIGKGRWLTYVVPLNEKTFLKFQIGGGGQTEPLTDLVKTLRRI